MKKLIVCYSKTGNNRKLAEFLGQELSADVELIETKKELSMFNLILDMIFSRKPKILDTKFNPEKYDHVIFIGPVWMGKLSSPLFSYMKKFQEKIKNYSFITISGGAIGNNDTLESNIHTTMNRTAKHITQLFINNLLPEEKKNQMKETSAFRIEDSDLTDRLKGDIDSFVKVLTI